MTRLSLASVGAAQGLALWLLEKRWPTTQPALAVAVALLVFIVASALVLHFAWTGRDGGRLVVLATAVGVLFAAVGGWLGAALPSGGAPAFGDETRAWTWALASPAAIYTLGPFLQVFQATGRARFPYDRLYLHAWNNFFIAAQGALFTIALWIVLQLWGELFALVGVDWFKELFARHFVRYVTTGAALGYGLALGRESEQTTAALRGLTQQLLRVLLPLLAVVTLTFLATIAGTGLAKLYATRQAAFILLSWVVAYLVLFNAVYQDGAGARPYPVAIRQGVEAAALVMPITATIGVYALWLRIEQHGLTPDRMWGALVGIVLLLYTLGYAAAVPSRAASWMPRVARVNIALALVVVTLALALHTPLLDPLAWSAQSQVRRLEHGRVGAADFDFAFLRFHLGRAGRDALVRLRDGAVGAEADRVRNGVDAALGAEKESKWRAGLSEQFQAERFERQPAGAPWPDGLLAAIGRTTGSGYLDRCGTLATCVVSDADLDLDGTPEAILVSSERPFRHGVVAVFQQENGSWSLLGWMRPSQSGSLPDVDLVTAARAGRIAVDAPKQQDLLIDGQRYRLLESAE